MSNAWKPQERAEGKMRPRPVLAIVRGVLEVALAMLAAGSVLGWIMTVGLIVGARASQFTPLPALVALAILYGLLGFAAGSVMGRRKGKTGVVCAVLGSMVAWGVLELLFWAVGVGLLDLLALRAPLVLAVPLSAIGGVVGMSRAEDRRIAVRELEEELRTVERMEDDTE